MPHQCLLRPAMLPRMACAFKAFGHPVRLGLLRLLLDGPRTISELAAMTHQLQPNVSRHSQVLAHAGLLRHRRAGSHVICSVDEPFIRQALWLAGLGPDPGLSHHEFVPEI